MLIDHPHAVVGQALRDMRLRERREARAVSYIKSRKGGVSSHELARVLGVSLRTSRRILATLCSRGTIAPADDGYRIAQEAA